MWFALKSVHIILLKDDPLQVTFNCHPILHNGWHRHCHADSSTIWSRDTSSTNLSVDLGTLLTNFVEDYR